MRHQKTFWLCNRDCYMAFEFKPGERIKAFVKGKAYEQISKPDRPLALRDERGANHQLSGWKKFFTIKTPIESDVS